MIAATLVFALAAAAAQKASAPNPCERVERNYWDPKFTPGQRWTYHSPKAGAMLVIAEVDNAPDFGVVVHVEILTPTRQHLAIRRDSLEASVIDVVDYEAFPDLGYNFWDWQQSCAAKTYSSTVVDSLKVIADQLCADRLKRGFPPDKSCQSADDPLHGRAAPARSASSNKPSPPPTAPAPQK